MDLNLKVAIGLGTGVVYNHPVPLVKNRRP